MSIRNLVPDIKSINLESLVTQIVADVKDTHRSSNVKIEIENAAAFPILTDEHVVSDILYQVILNAMQFADTSKSDQTVSIKAIAQNDILEVEISDNGLGIDELVMPRIFDLYYRGSDASNGSGLGLYLVKNAVEKLDGTISVSSRARIGTQVRIAIPFKT
jgi:signal transduction histidine kinase